MYIYICVYICVYVNIEAERVVHCSNCSDLKFYIRIIRFCLVQCCVYFSQGSLANQSNGFVV